MATAFLALAPGGALLQDPTAYGDAELEFTLDEFKPDVGTGSYLSAYLELGKRGFYAGI